MSEAEIVPFPEAPASPELEYLLASVPEEHHKAIQDAFHRASSGDPESFPVAFTVQVLALVALLKAYPDKLRRRIAPDVATLVNTLGEGSGIIQTAAQGIARDAAAFVAQSQESLATVRATNAALHAVLTEHAEVQKALKEEFATGTAEVKRVVAQLMNLQAGLIMTAMGISALTGALLAFLGMVWTGYHR